MVVPLDPPVGEQALRFPVRLEAGRASRTFITAPSAADYATVKLVTGEVAKGPHTVSLHCVPNARGDADAGHDETRAMRMLRPNAEVAVKVPVKADATLEVCLALSFLNNPEPTDVSQGGAVLGEVRCRISESGRGLRGTVTPTIRCLLGQSG